MNEKNLKIIVKNYILKYNDILKDGSQSHLWRTASGFKALADDAMNASEEDFSDKIFKLSSQSMKPIDDKFIQPMNGLNDFAAKEPDAVRRLLKSLFAPDWGNADIRQHKIMNFVSGWNELRGRYFPCSMRYFMTVGKALAILFMYDPDNNYMYQESAARLFAECTGFEDSWGRGNNFVYEVYCRMCDELTEYIRGDQQLIFTSCGRYAQEEGLYADMHYHLLAYDIILSNVKYKLYDGIKFSSRTLEENRQLHRSQQEAIVSMQKYRDAWGKNLELTKGLRRFQAMVQPGIRISHIKMGEGIIRSFDGESVSIAFKDETVRKFSLLHSVLQGFITIHAEGFDEWKAEYEAVVSHKTEIRNQLEVASGRLEDQISLITV